MGSRLQTQREQVQSIHDLDYRGRSFWRNGEWLAGTSQETQPNEACCCLVAKSCLMLATLWMVAYQAPLSMGFSKEGYWSGLLFPSPGDLPNPGIEPRSAALQADSLPYKPLGKAQVRSDRVPEKLWTEVHDIEQEAVIKTIPKKKKRKGKMVVWGDLTNSWEKKRSERQRRKGKIYSFECRVPKNSMER